RGIAFRRARFRNALGTAGKDHARRPASANCVDRRVRRPHLGVHRQLAQAARDQLRILRAEIEHDDGLMGHGRNHYYNGVASRRTTRCCSAVALLAVWSSPSAASAPHDNLPLPLFPTRPVWTLALNNQLAVPPAYDATRAFFSLAGDRVVCYEIGSGVQQWLVTARPRMEPVTGDGLLLLVEPDTLTALHVGDGTIGWQLPFTDS